MKTLEFLTGRTTDQLVPFEGGPFLVHKNMRDDLCKLVFAAASFGIELTMFTSFRSFEDQKKIWNDKVLGLRPVLDSHSKPIDITTKTKEELLFLILRWSALPGASRHHWGTDFDFFDSRALPTDYKIQLIPSEYEKNGPFYNANIWLLENMGDFGFYQPYAEDNGGVASEPWHLSHSPLSEKFLEDYSYPNFLKHLEISDFLLIDEVKQHSAEIFQRFVQMGKLLTF
jgi:LAS superfamily LD-carboxypeptidase LdcB